MKTLGVRDAGGEVGAGHCKVRGFGDLGMESVDDLVVPSGSLSGGGTLARARLRRDQALHGTRFGSPSRQCFGGTWAKSPLP